MNETFALTRRWTILFDTDDGKCHPLRLVFEEMVTKEQAESQARTYMNGKPWLVRVGSVYPTQAIP